MLVIDRVELAALHQAQQVLHLESGDAFGFQDGSDAAHEIIDVGHMGEDIISGDEVGLPAACGQRLAICLGHELDIDVEAQLARGLSRTGGGFDAEAGDACLFHILQQIAVVAGDLDDLAVRRQSETVDDHVDIGLGVGQPCRRM